MTSVPNLTVVWHENIASITPQAWNNLCSGRDIPFLRWEWLHLLETSGSVASRNGWQPCHLTIHSPSGMVGAAPLYLKAHSDGEFVFDHAWAQLAAGMGVRYYPKLVGMSPFSPVTAYRFLVADHLDEIKICTVMVREIERFCRRHDVSGCGFHFVTTAWGRILERLGYKVWVHQGFVWMNPGFTSFEDYLGGLKANQRRNVRRERGRLVDRGITTQCLYGRDIPESFFSQMYEFYARHNDRFGQWSCKFLTPGFFQGLRDTFRDNLLIIAAYAPGEIKPLAMSLLIVAGDRVYGRYWGARREEEFLHFELCYYKPMEWMIQHGLRLFDPGMGGVHKALRGFVSAPNYSLHMFQDPRLHGVMATSIAETNRMELRDIAALNSILPYKRRG
ncbi:GNAT family N-acetyltransferase [Desulfonatronum thioautotrophicum]|uniref:GNAT family N-acetyltransferase n=1 Tax=Desulfonatronum thioautotrophicum TaxID=617001 RepID=UPI000A0298A6|nr:GNAT family N-acetyltransferase [Desulfonatronum thioautotrophicum]